MLCDPTWQHSFYQISHPPLATHAFNYSSSSTTFLLSNFSPPLATHALRPYLTTFLLSNFPPPLGNPCFQWFKFKYNIPFIKFFPPPLATHALRPYLTTFLLSNFPPPLATHAFNDSSSSTTFPLSNFSFPLGNPCFATLPDNIPFIKIPPPPWQPMLSMIQVQVQHSFYKNSPPPWQPMLCDPTWQHSFYQISHPPLATHAFNDSSSSTTFLLSNFSPPLGNPCFATLPDNIPFIKFSTPPWQPMLSMIQVQVQHSFYQIFPPPWQPMLCDPTWQHSFYQIFLPPWQPMLSMIQVQVQHSFYQIFPSPLATHALRPYLTTFLLSKFPPPWANHALRPYLTTFLFIKFSPPWQPMLSMIQVQVQHSFYQIFPPPLGNPCFATLPDNIPFINFPPPLGNPCFQWFKFKYNIPFIQFSPPLGNPCFATLPDNIPFIKFPPPLATHAFNDSSSSTTFLLSNFSLPPWQPMLCDPTWQHSFYQISPPPWQPMLSMIQVQVQHSLDQIFPSPLATHALRPYLTTFLLSKFPPPWQPMLSMIQVQVQHSIYKNFPPPLLATHALRPYLTTFLLSNFPPPLGNPCFQWFKFKYNIPFIKFFPSPWQPMLCDPTWQHSFYQIFHPPLGNPCFQWFKFKYNIPFIKFSPPLGNPCFATLPDNIPFIKFPPPLGNPCFQWFKFKYNIPFIKFFLPPWQPMLCDPTWQHSFYQNFPPPPWANHALRPYLTTFLFIKFSPPWQPMLSMIQVQVQHSFYQIFPPPLGNPCFATLPDNIPFIKFSPPPWQPMLSMIQVQVQHSFYPIFPPPLGNPCFATLPDNIPFIKFPPPWQPMLSMIQVQVQHSFYQISPPPPWQPHIQPNIASKHATKTRSQRTARSLSTPRKNKQPYSTATLPNYFFKSTLPNRGRVTQHTIQPHVASKSANARPRHAVQAPPETSQHHAKHKAYSSATLPNYCFPSTVPNTRRVTQHTIYSQT